jgi:acetolactate synthase-1/2/3 large subunit
MYHAVTPILDFPDMRFVTTRHEQATTYMADGYARASGKVGTAMVVPGPGLQNASAGITNAYAASSPVLIISGQINRDMIGKNVGMLHEINDQLDIVRPVTKWQARILEAKKIPASVREAFSQLRTGRPRPVEIEIPPETLAEVTGVEPYDPEEASQIPIDDRAIEKAAELLTKSKQPVIWAGGGIHSSGASQELLQVAEYLAMPVITTGEGKGAISDSHYLSLGVTRGRSTGESKDPLRDFFYTCDVVLAVGTRFASAQANKTQKVIQIDIDQEEIGRNHGNTLGIAGDARVALADLLEALKSLAPARPSMKDKFESMRTERYNNPASEIEPQGSFVRTIRDNLPDDGILVPDMTQVGYYARTHFHVYHPRSFFTSSYNGNLGSAFPTALGAKVAMPDKAVVSVSGDGGFLFNSQELATSVQFGINVVAIVFNDQAYGNVLRDMKSIFNGRALGAELRNPDFVKLAEAYGVVGMRANGPEELGVSLRKAIDMDKPVLIEVPVGPMPSPF